MLKSYNLLNTLAKHSLRTFLLLISVIFIFEAVPVTESINRECEAQETTTTRQNEIIELIDEILANRKCPCQCGKYLPGSPNLPACFGCSAGKAEISYVLESLESGKNKDEILLNLDSPVIVDIFADYTDSNISKLWNHAKTVTSELHQRRVVLRPPGLTKEAQRAIKIAEYARFVGKFSIIQEALIKHKGPWDWRTLIDLVARYVQIPHNINDYINSIEIDQQIAKDQEHAIERNIESYPTITINNAIVLATDTAIRQSIEKILLENSI
ncbi:MAG: hypothetical protein MAG551_00950 [Candidatus Scalindua arabica]|uniref:Thioredoxin-like fold domain-containing protein n=1 Tax=Candidatus Scalindua arabica TaxID=1127984 RepID=A0A942A4E2_9BACT|nr:hypothetical protein [Candidatus Scalindua arabica]